MVECSEYRYKADAVMKVECLSPSGWVGVSLAYPNYYDQMLQAIRTQIYSRVEDGRTDSWSMSYTEPAYVGGLKTWKHGSFSSPTGKVWVYGDVLDWDIMISQVASHLNQPEEVWDIVHAFFAWSEGEITNVEYPTSVQIGVDYSVKVTMKNVSPTGQTFIFRLKEGETEIASSSPFYIYGGTTTSHTFKRVMPNRTLNLTVELWRET